MMIMDKSEYCEIILIYAVMQPKFYWFMGT